MPMDWNQDPDLQRLEEKLDQVIEFQLRQKTTNNNPKTFFSFEECKEILQCSDRTLRYYLFESFKHKLPYLKLGRKILIKEGDLFGFIDSLKEDSSKRSLL
jgi:hypothetical protein|tara:strand:- start:11 stop:313 length:303 start_codon:yes stop_codon:yes gene_type:complete